MHRALLSLLVCIASLCHLARISEAVSSRLLWLALMNLCMVTAGCWEEAGAVRLPQMHLAVTQGSVPAIFPVLVYICTL